LQAFQECNARCRQPHYDGAAERVRDMSPLLASFHPPALRECEACGAAMRGQAVWCKTCGHTLGRPTTRRVPSIDELIGHEVDLFVDTVEREARYPALAILLWATLGWIGAHRFYLGRSGSALLMVLLLLGSIVTMVGLHVDQSPHAGWPLLVMAAVWLLDGLTLRSLLRGHRRVAEWTALVTVGKYRDELALYDQSLDGRRAEPASTL